MWLQSTGSSVACIVQWSVWQNWCIKTNGEGLACLNANTFSAEYMKCTTDSGIQGPWYQHSEHNTTAESCEKVSQHAHQGCLDVAWLWLSTCGPYFSGHHMLHALECVGLSAIQTGLYTMWLTYVASFKKVLNTYVEWRDQGHGGAAIPAAVQGVLCMGNPSANVLVECLSQQPGELSTVSSAPSCRQVWLQWASY